MTAILEIEIKDPPAEKPKLSKVIDYDTHVKPYRFIQLISGLGSGKNYWVENDLMPKYNVLLITSRKAKVTERMSETGLSNCLNLNKLADDEIRRILIEIHRKYHNAICNNWQIEHYIKYVYNPKYPKRFLWQFFGHISVDEAHSLQQMQLIVVHLFMYWIFSKQHTLKASQKSS